MSLKIITVVDSLEDRLKIIEKFPFLEGTFLTKESIQNKFPELKKLKTIELYEDEFSIIEIAQYCFDSQINGYIYYISYSYDADLYGYSHFLDWEFIEKYNFEDLVKNCIWFDKILNYIKTNEYLSNLLAIDSDELELNKNGFSEFSLKGYNDNITVSYYNSNILITICSSVSINDYNNQNIRKLLNVSYETWLELNEYEKLETKVKELIFLRNQDLENEFRITRSRDYNAI